MSFRASLVFLDTAGGLIQAPLQTFVLDGNLPIATIGCPIQNHGIPPHDAAVIAEGSSFVTINGIPVAMELKKATCGDILTGSSVLRISG